MIKQQVEQNEKLTPLTDLLPDCVREVMERLDHLGEQTILQGNAAQAIVRDAPPRHMKGSCLITTAPPATIEKELKKLGKGTLVKKPDSRVFRLEGLPSIHPSVSEPVSIRIESLRKRTPPTPWFSELRLKGLERDLATREITVRAFGIQRTGALVDPFGGAEDAKAGALRSVVPNKRAFKENGLWALKMARHIGETGLDPQDNVYRHARVHAGRILDVPVGLWRPHLNRLLLSDHVEKGLDFLLESGTLRFICPEVVSMVDFHLSCPVHHKDLWDHTKKVIAQAEKNLTVRWAALMHDIGKVWTRSVTHDRKVHFFRHEEFGALLFRGVAGRLELTPEFTDAVDYVIKNHSRVNLYDSNWTDSAVRRLIKECGEFLPELICFSKADFTTKRQSKVRELKRQLQELETRIERIREDDAKPRPLPKGLGNLLMKRFEIPPGKELGELRAWLIEEVENGNVPRQADPEIYMDYLLKHAERIETAGGSIRSASSIS